MFGVVDLMTAQNAFLIISHLLRELGLEEEKLGQVEVRSFQCRRDFEALRYVGTEMPVCFKF